MAGQWIKMRTNLRTDPKVVRISSALNADILRTIGALHVLWSVFDDHSENGELDGYSIDIMDGLIGWTGFCAAVEKIGWLEVRSNSLIATNFQEHNGQTAKRRAKEAVRKMSARDADKKRTREEKRRVIVKGVPAWFDQDAYIEYRTHCAQKRSPVTDAQLRQLIAWFEESPERQKDQKAIFAQSVRSGWVSVRDLQGGSHAKRGKSRFESDSEALDEFERQAERELRQGSGG